MSTVWKVVDDTSSDIRYLTKWGIASGNTSLGSLGGTINSKSQEGDVFNNTLHVFEGNGTVFSFKFNGTSRIAVYSTQTTTRSKADDEVSDITTHCALDGEEFSVTEWEGFTVDAGPSVNNELRCVGTPNSFVGPAGLPGEHVLTVNVTTKSPDFKVYLDYILYESLPNAPVDGDTLQIGNHNFNGGKDPHLVFSRGWNVSKETGLMSTSTPGSNVTVEFNGTAIQLYGDIFTYSSNIASYQVDNQPPQSFELFRPPDLTLRYTTQMLFNISSLDPGEHNVVVNHTGEAGKIPLTIRWFTITSLTAAQQAALSMPSSSSSTAPSPTSAPPMPTTAPSHKSIGAVIGGVIGGLAALALVAWACIGRKRRRQASSRFQIEPFEPSGGSNNLGERTPMRFGNLKRQQRLASVPEPQVSEEVQVAQPSAPRQMVHEDSGWRMEQQASSRPVHESIEEFPPMYTTR